jgi:Family of unknown function (DUF6481)
MGPPRNCGGPSEKLLMSGKDLKGSGLTDRLSAAADAKAALLAKLKPKPTVTDPLFEQRAALREAERKAELHEVRTVRADEKEATRQAAADALAADHAAIAAAEEAALAEKRGARKERKQLTKAEAQTKRDARYAARKAR